MTDILLISDSTANINIAWRHFCYKEYNANATMSIDTAMEHLRSDKPPQIAVYYYSSGTSGFIEFYRRLRSDEKTASIPLVVLADADQQKALAEYIKLENAVVMGIFINDSKLMDIMRMIARKGTADLPILQGGMPRRRLNEIKAPDTIRRRGDG